MQVTECGIGRYLAGGGGALAKEFLILKLTTVD